MVYLTGCGTGDIKLLTIKAKEVLEKADVVIYDALINKDLIKFAPNDAEIIYVGKRSKNHTLSQEEINNLLVEKGKQNHNVVRLKGGDPYVFGRGGEEGEFLFKNKIPFEIIPGVTSAITGLTYAGIPITHRDNNSSFMVITGHRKTKKLDLDFKNIAQFKGTKVFLMSVKNLNLIVNNLIQNGLNPKTPCALIYMASTPSQKTIVSDLENILEDGKNIKSPALFVIGDVINHRDHLNFFENKPLFSKRILITRARPQISQFKEKLEDLGAQVFEFSTIKVSKDENELKKLQNSFKNLKDYNFLIFTSANAVDLTLKELFKTDLDVRSLANLKIVAIGPGTNKALEKYGLKADIIPNSFIAESLYETIKDQIEGKRILFPRSGDARAYLNDQLSQKALVDEIRIYHTEPENKNRDEIKEKIQNNLIDAITFTSSSTAKNFAKSFKPEEVKNIEIYSIGPQTTKTLKELGFEVKSQAEEFSLDGLIEVLKRDLC